MLRLPVADLSLHSVLELTPTRLTAMGIRLLLLDLDNTIAEYGATECAPGIVSWLDSLKSAGIEAMIFSNNRGGRPARFAEMLNIGFVERAKKPNPKKLLRLLEELGVCKKNAALAGDQIFTDIFCARRADVLAISVRPLSLKAPHRALRYAAETPFRLAARVRR